MSSNHYRVCTLPAHTTRFLAAHADTETDPTLLDGNRTSCKSLVPLSRWQELPLKVLKHQRGSMSFNHYVSAIPSPQTRNSKSQSFCGKHARRTFPSTKTKKYAKKPEAPPNNEDSMP